MGNEPIVPTVPPPPGGGWGGGGLIEAGDVFHIFHSVPLGQGKDFSTKKKKKKKIGQNYHQRVWRRGIGEEEGEQEERQGSGWGEGEEYSRSVSIQ